MSMQNLAIVFGPTLLGQPMPAPSAGAIPMPDTFHQNLVGLFNWKYRHDSDPLLTGN
jgi:hypothetical protein